jgi:hypothetical protein
MVASVGMVETVWPDDGEVVEEGEALRLGTPDPMDALHEHRCAGTDIWNQVEGTYHVLAQMVPFLRGLRLPRRDTPRF